MDDGEFHEKRYVVIHVDGNVCTCVINSDISNFIRARPDLNRCQVDIDQATHPYMDHDSKIDCSRVRVYPVEAILAQLEENPTWILGKITDPVRVNMSLALRHSTAIAIAEVGIYCASLDSADLA